MNYSDDEWNLDPKEDVSLSDWPAPMNILTFHKTERGLFLTLEGSTCAAYNGTRFYSTRRTPGTNQPWWCVWDGSFPEDIIFPIFIEDFSDEEIERAESLLQSL